MAALENCSATVAMILPRICVGCNLPSEDPALDLCKYCIPHLPWLKDRCYQCGGALQEAGITCNKCREYPPPYARLCALFSYDPPLSKIIYGLKFGGKLNLAKLLGSLLATHLREHCYQDRKLPAVIIPVPLHTKRLRQRGYNQAAELAKVVAQNLDLPLDLNGCTRNRNTKMQARLPKAQRQQNLSGAFVAETTAKYVALVDDVVTTGSTIRAVCVALNNAGVEQIDVWSVCRG